MDSSITTAGSIMKPIMDPHFAHRWDLQPVEARALQSKLAASLQLSDDVGPIRRIAGVDVAFPDRGRRTRAAVAVLDARTLEVCQVARVIQPTRFPYVPGLLSFREIPAILAAMEELDPLPDVLLCDGQGIAHPRRFGVACHLGLLTGIPSVGVAKSRLTGRHAELPREKGATVPLRDGDETIGTVLRSRTGVRPLYISPGHRVSLETAVDLTWRCITRYRLPETTRAADRLAGEERK